MVAELVTEMTATMRAEQGIGLAANQIGSDLSIFVLGIKGELKVFLNPTLIEKSEEVDFEEGCLSIPGISATTKRFNKVKLSYVKQDAQDLSKITVEEFEGMEAFAIQHEMDHLNGKTYLDQFGPVKRGLLVEKHQKYVKQLERRG